jgi:hypothetical protein
MLTGDGDGAGCTETELTALFVATKNVTDAGNVPALIATEYGVWIVNAHPAFLSSFDVGS